MAGVKLKVFEAAVASDVGRGIVRIGSEQMKALGVKKDDTVRLVGAKATLVKVSKLPSEEDDMDFVRMDSLIRGNCGVALGDSVGLEKAKVERGKSVELSPINIRVSDDRDFVKFVLDRLVGRSVTKGDTVSITMLGEAILFTVADVSPGDAVGVFKDTSLKIFGEPVGTKKKETVRLVVARDNEAFEMASNEKLLSSTPLFKSGTSNDRSQIEIPYAVALWFIREL